MTGKEYKTRRHALKLGAIGIAPYSLKQFTDSEEESKGFKITQAMTPAVKKGYQAINNSNEDDFSNLLITVKNTGTSPLVLGDAYILSGAPYSVSYWKDKYYGGWGGEIQPNSSVDKFAQGSDETNGKPLEFKWRKDEKVLERAPDQFRSQQRTFPEDYAQGETYTAKFGVFLKGNDGNKSPVTDTLTLKYYGGMEKIYDVDSYSIWVPKYVESTESDKPPKQSATSTQTSTSEKETTDSEDESPVTVENGRISNGEIAVEVTTSETQRPTFINSIKRGGKVYKKKLMTVPIDRAANEYFKFESIDMASSFSNNTIAGYKVRRTFATSARTLTIETAVGVLPSHSLVLANIRFLNTSDQSVQLNTKPNFVANGIGMGRADIRSPKQPYRYHVSGHEPQEFSQASKWATSSIAGELPYVMAFDSERALAIGLLQGTTDSRMAMTEGKPHQIRLFVNPIELTPGDGAEWTLAVTAHNGGSNARNQAQELLTTANKYKQKLTEGQKQKTSVKKDDLPKRVIVKCLSDDLQRYKFRVTGEVKHLEPNEDSGAAVDTIQGNTVKGMVGKGDDRFAFSGDLIKVHNPAPVQMVVESR